jgi:hypothetical protein
MAMETFPAPAREAESPDELLGHATALVRVCAQDAVIAGVLLVMVLVGVLTQLAGGASGPFALPLLLIPGLAFCVSAGLVVRARRTMVAALSSVRGHTGAPLDPGVPWRPFGLDAALQTRVRDGELRRLLAAAHRCSELSWQAVVWGVVTAVLFLFWTMAMVTL